MKNMADAPVVKRLSSFRGSKCIQTLPKPKTEFEVYILCREVNDIVSHLEGLISGGFAKNVSVIQMQTYVPSADGLKSPPNCVNGVP